MTLEFKKSPQDKPDLAPGENSSIRAFLAAYELTGKSGPENTNTTTGVKGQSPDAVTFDLQDIFAQVSSSGRFRYRPNEPSQVKAGSEKERKEGEGAGKHNDGREGGDGRKRAQGTDREERRQRRRGKVRELVGGLKDTIENPSKQDRKKGGGHDDLKELAAKLKHAPEKVMQLKPVFELLKNVEGVEPSLTEDKNGLRVRITTKGQTVIPINEEHDAGYGVTVKVHSCNFDPQGYAFTIALTGQDNNSKDPKDPKHSSAAFRLGDLKLSDITGITFPTTVKAPLLPAADVTPKLGNATLSKDRQGNLIIKAEITIKKFGVTKTIPVDVPLAPAKKEEPTSR